MADKAKTEGFDVKKAKREFNTHVSVIQFQEGLPVADARATAWAEGPLGLAKRLTGRATEA